MNHSFKTVSIKVGKDNLSGVLFVPEKGNLPYPSVVIFHGMGSRKERYLERVKILADNGFLTLVFDFRGCGESDGFGFGDGGKLH